MPRADEHVRKIKKVVYLLGAGATHAEILNLEGSPNAGFRGKYGLLISDVSKRVIARAQKNLAFKTNVEFVTSAKGSLNIELLISLLASNGVQDSDTKVNYLKRLVKQDITSILSPDRRNGFYLHKALLELHELNKEKEELLGIISLNYDSIIDEAYNARSMPINYCMNPEKGKQWPLLKLHGSFAWSGIRTYGKPKDIAIIPLGTNKNYLIPPYNFIWGRSFDILAKCDVLRVIGCSLNQNDVGLIDLLFKAHLERKSNFKIEIIDFQEQGDLAKNNYGFFPEIVKPIDIENSLIADEKIEKRELGGNPFKIWLKAKAGRMINERMLKKTKYLSKCV